jgi:hypothetical protein
MPISLTLRWPWVQAATSRAKKAWLRSASAATRVLSDRSAKSSSSNSLDVGTRPADSKNSPLSNATRSPLRVATAVACQETAVRPGPATPTCQLIPRGCDTQCFVPPIWLGYRVS